MGSQIVCQVCLVKYLPNGDIVLECPNPTLEAVLDREHTRVPGELRWIPKQNIFVKAKAAISTMTSPIVDIVEYYRRLNICNACPKLIQVEDKKYCGACGCGRTPFSELHSKLKRERARCPLRKFEKS